MSDKKVIAVVGQTAAGKTALGVRLAKFFETEIVSADSQLIYKGLDIGTAKPYDKERQGIQHHMIDVVTPDTVYSVADYKTDARMHLEKLWSNGKVPIVVGGTGFYLEALLQPSVLPDIPVNPAFRAQLHRLAKTDGSETLHNRLQRLDPDRAQALHPNDHMRIIRALEIIEATGKPVPTKKIDSGIQVFWAGLHYENRDLLRLNIEARIKSMLATGWLEEVEALARQYGFDAHALTVAHGYPELMTVLRGEQTLEDASTQIGINVRQYARRQLTWFKRNKNIHWFSADTTDLSQITEMVLQKINTWIL